MLLLRKWIVTTTRMPTNHHACESFVVEAATEQDAQALVKDHLRDLGDFPNYVYAVKPYVEPPQGRVLGSLSKGS